MPRGYFITFEGLDGSGKTTQLKRLAASLDARGLATTELRQPGGTALGDRIRSIVLDSRSEANVGPITPHAELALMFADRAQAIAEAYQGAGRQLGSAAVLELHHAVCGGLQPDLTLLLLPPLASSLRRARRRNQRHIQLEGTDENRFERESDEFYTRIYHAYQQIAARDADRILTIESDGSIDDINTLIVEAVIRRLPSRVESA